MYVRCLQEISYLTSPQAMNPLPNRPLLSNSSLPVALPNVPSFEQIAFNGRPTKRLQDVGKDFPLMNGMSTMLPNAPPSGPSSQPERPPSVGPPAATQHQPPSATLGQQPPPLAQLGQLPTSGESQQPDPKGKEEETDGQRITAIFRPDDDFKEKLRLSHEAADRARLEGSGSLSGAASWEGRAQEEDEDVKEEEPADMEDEEGTEIGEGEDTKIWKAKRTLRKLVSSHA